MKEHIATISLRWMPVSGAISLNRREYPAETIENVVKTANEEISSGRTLTALTHHEAGDNNLLIVGKCDSAIYQKEDWYWADFKIADTEPGRDIAYLAANGYLQSCSLRGSNAEVEWPSEESKEKDEDAMPKVTGFHLDGVDFTNYPGIAQTDHGNASIGGVSWESALKGALMEDYTVGSRPLDTFAVEATIELSDDMAGEVVERAENAEAGPEGLAEELLESCGLSGESSLSETAPVVPVKPTAQQRFASAIIERVVRSITDSVTVSLVEDGDATDGDSGPVDTSKAAPFQSKKMAGQKTKKTKKATKTSDSDAAKQSAPQAEAEVVAEAPVEPAADVAKENDPRKAVVTGFAEMLRGLTHRAVRETASGDEPSQEDIRDMVQDAIQDACGNSCWCFVVASLADHVVYERIDFDRDGYWSGEPHFFRQDYSVAGGTVSLSGDPQPVILSFIPMPANWPSDHDADDESTSKESFDMPQELIERLTAVLEKLAGQPAPSTEAAPTTQEVTETETATEAVTEPVATPEVTEVAATTETTQATETVANATQTGQDAILAALSGISTRIGAMEAEIGQLKAGTATRPARKGLVPATETVTEPAEKSAVEAIVADSTLSPEEKLHRFLEARLQPAA